MAEIFFDADTNHLCTVKRLFLMRKKKPGGKVLVIITEPPAKIH